MSKTREISDLQLETLRELESAIRCNPGARITPLLLGGTDGSHHSSTLAALCRKGLAERKKFGILGPCRCKVGPNAQFGHRCRGSCTYSITEAGRAELTRGLRGKREGGQ